MSRSLSVLAVGDVGSAVPDCADYWLCQKIYDWFGLDADGIRIPLPLLTGSAGAAAGVR